MRGQGQTKSRAIQPSSILYGDIGERRTQEHQYIDTENWYFEEEFINNLIVNDEASLRVDQEFINELKAVADHEDIVEKLEKTLGQKKGALLPVKVIDIQDHGKLKRYHNTEITITHSAFGECVVFGGDLEPLI